MLVHQRVTILPWLFPDAGGGDPPAPLQRSAEPRLRGAGIAGGGAAEARRLLRCFVMARNSSHKY